MDDDKQIKDITPQSAIGRFLNKPVLPDDRDREHFDLEKEFAKSAKNRSLMVPLVVAIFLVVLAIGAWVASQFTEQASQKSSVSIGSFEDLKLKEIFDTARKNKKDLEAIQAEIDRLTQESDAKVAALTRSGNSKADIAAVNDATGVQVKAIQAQTARDIAAEKAALAATLKPLKAQADEVQKKIDSYDDRIGQMNKKNQQVLDTQQRLFDLEKKKLVDQYELRIQQQIDEAATTLARVKQERDDLIAALKAKHADDIRKLILKYNPVLSDPLLKAQLAQDGSAPALPMTPLFPDRIGQKELVTADLQAEFAARVAKTQALLAVFRSIPYENSVPALINTLDKAINDSLVGFNGYLAPLAAHMVELDGVIAAREATIRDREATIAEREATIAARDATIAQLQTVIAGLQSDLRDAEVARLQAEADRKAAEAKEAADRAAERELARLELARWTTSVDAYVSVLRDEWDGVFVDLRGDQSTWMVVLKPDRATALAAALANPPANNANNPVNQVLVRDGQNNDELGRLLLEYRDGAWKVATILRQNDPKKPFKSFDRLRLENLPRR